MIIRKIKIKNIRSYKEAEIDFPDGSTLLMGDIGSGKTSILLAIEFALFGLQPGQKGNSLLRNNEKEASVRLEFEVDEDRIVIERGLEKSGKSVSQTDIAISINNDRLEGSVTEIKNRILNILSYPQEFAKKTNDLYKFTVYTPQEEMKQIVQESNDVRLNTLRHVFGIDKYKRIEENIDILTTKIRQDIRVKEAEMGNIEQKTQAMNQKKELIIQQQIKALELEKEISLVQATKNEKQKEIDSLNEKINEKKKLENEKDKSEFSLNSKKDIFTGYEREIKNIKEQIEKTGNLSFNEREVEDNKARLISNERILRDLNEEYIKILSSLAGSESKIRELKMLKEKIASLDKCTTCLQIVNEEHKHNIASKAMTEVSELDSKVMHEKKNKEDLMIKIEQTKKLIDSLRSSISQAEIVKVRLEGLKEKHFRLEQIEKQKSIVASDIEMIKKHIDGLISIIRDFNFYETEFSKKNLELREISNKENLLLIRKAETNKEMQFLERQIKDLEEEIKKIEELAKKLNYMKEVEFWLNNKFIELILFTEKNVMLKLREEFSKLFSDWFSVLVPEGITVKLDEGFSPIINQKDSELEYNYLSGGERTAVALAYRLALNQVINSLLSKIKTRDLVILDEPTDGFSESQLDKMRDIFNQLKVKQLIIVSHEQKIEGFVDNIIRFKKLEGVTQIEKSMPQ